MSSGEKVRLGDVASIEKADAPQDELVWLLSLDAVEKDTGRLIEKTMVPLSEVGSSTVAFSPKSVLYSKLRPNLNKVVMPDEGGFATSEMLPLIADGNVLDRRYFAAFLRSRAFVGYAVASTAGAKMPRVNKKTVLDAKIRLPELQIQKERAATLVAIESKIAAANQQIAQLDQVVKSRFVEMFGTPNENPYNYEKGMLGDVLSVQPSNGLYKPQKDYVQDGSGNPIIRIDSFRREGADFTRLKRLKCTGAELTRFGIRENDIVVNRVNSVGCMGKTMLVSSVPEPTVFESNMMRLHADESRMVPRFMSEQMTTEYSKAYFEKNAKRAIGQASINQADVKKLPVLIPPLETQRAYLDFVDCVDKTRAIAQRQIDKLQTLYDSLAQEYFS